MNRLVSELASSLVICLIGEMKEEFAAYSLKKKLSNSGIGLKVNNILCTVFEKANTLISLTKLVPIFVFLGVICANSAPAYLILSHDHNVTSTMPTYKLQL